ncbi:MAG TPA: FtsQ-type POTRA domain-containing protein [Candidatus Dormibacteraeota bacterium]|nr:FtsQ-type POTRA domain-containing protein [Candidatus Dormibacteraeota bacterium]
MEKRRGPTAPAPAAPVAASRGWIWALIQLAVLGTEIFAALFLLAQPSFRPQQFEISGIRHVRAADVRAVLNLPPDRSIFFVSHTELEQRVETLPWVHLASVNLALPNRVSISVSEWKPSAVLQVGESSYALNDVGQVLEPASEAGRLLVINRPEAGSVRIGQRVVAAELLPMLQQLRAGFQPAFRVSISSFTIDRREVLTAQTDRGWSIVFGQMLTADDRGTLEPKLAALRALSSRLDLIASPIAYINLENPGAPAVQMRGRK